MKKVILLLSVIVVIGAGCKNTPSQPKPSIGILPIAKIENQGFTRNQSYWVLTDSSNGANFSQNVSFLRPPEFKVIGDDTDYGRITMLQLNNKDYVEIVENGIFSKCPKAQCDGLDELVGVSQEEYLDEWWQELKKEGIIVSDKKIGNLSGKFFINKGGAVCDRACPNLGS